MRKILTISLVGLLLFNVMGYYGLLVSLQYKNQQDLLQSFDSETYSLAHSVIIKVPLVVPYANDSQGYERVNGEFEHEGEFYHLVKQRLYQDTLFIVCVKDNQSKKINKALTDYVKTFTDNPSPLHNNSKPLPSFIKEYLGSSCNIHQLSTGWTLEVSEEPSAVVFIPSFTASIIHPPERA